MFKTISAALLAVSVVAAPAVAAAGRTTPAPVIRSVQAKPSMLNANARMGHHHHRHLRHLRHYRSHKH